VRKAFFIMVGFACALWLLAVVLVAAGAARQPQSLAGEPAAKAAEDSLVIPKGATVYVAPMPDSFDDYLKKAIQSKKVPLTLVESRDQADFEITGTAESKKAGAAKIIILGSWHSRESASIMVINLKSRVIAFAYSYSNYNSAHGKRSSAESCAKHLKQKIERGK
jgi:hypothetical protein